MLASVEVVVMVLLVVVYFRFLRPIADTDGGLRAEGRLRPGR